MIDGLSGTSDNNLYYSPSATAFLDRSQRWGTDSWTNSSATGYPNLPTWTLAGWQSMNLNNANNANTNKAVDANSTLVTSLYDETKPLVAIAANVISLLETDTNAPTMAFTVTRVSMGGYANPLTVNYSVRANAGDALNGVDFQTLSGTITIPAGARSATIALMPITDQIVESTLSLIHI